MKKIIIATSYAVAMLISCNSSSTNNGVKPEVLQHDSIPVLAMYKSAMTGQVQYGIVTRVVIDTFAYVDTDSLTKMKKWTKDTTYIVSYPTEVDSLISKRYNVPLLDSSGKKYSINLIINQDKKYVRSGWDRVDSIAVKELMNQK